MENSNLMHNSNTKISIFQAVSLIKVVFFLIIFSNIFLRKFKKDHWIQYLAE